MFFCFRWYLAREFDLVTTVTVTVTEALVLRSVLED